MPLELGSANMEDRKDFFPMREDSQGYNNLFLKNLGIQKHISLAYYSQVKGQAELTIKTATCTLIDNVESCGQLCQDHAAHVLLTYCNTLTCLLQKCYSHVIKDYLSVQLDKYQICKELREISEQKDAAIIFKKWSNFCFFVFNSISTFLVYLMPKPSL